MPCSLAQAKLRNNFQRQSANTYEGQETSDRAHELRKLLCEVDSAGSFQVTPLGQRAVDAVNWVGDEAWPGALPQARRGLNPRFTVFAR